MVMVTTVQAMNNMKYLIVLLVHLLAFSIAYAEDAPSCRKGSDCEVVKTFTKCDVDKQALRNKIAKLEQELEQLRQKQPIVIINDIVREETVILKHIVSVVAYETIISSSTSQNNGVAQAEMSKGYVPAVTYQYQFDLGLVPLIGVDIKSKPQLIFGLGYEF